MSYEPFMLNETPPVVSAQQARDVARQYKGFAEYMRRLGARGDALALERQSAWWMTYSLVLAQTNGEPT
jgi:muconolactone delta-isomerase